MHFYKISMYNLWDRAGEMNAHEFSVLASVIRANRKLSELGSVEQEVMRNLQERGFVSLVEDVFVPNFLVFKREPKDRYLARLPQYEQLQAEMDVYYKSVYAIIGRDVPSRLNRQLKFVSGEFLYNMRMMSLRHALEQGHIVLPVEPEKSTIAMLMMIGL